MIASVPDLTTLFSHKKSHPFMGLLHHKNAEMFLGQPSNIIRDESEDLGVPASQSSSGLILWQVLHYPSGGHQRHSLSVAHSSNQLGSIVFIVN